jgi:pimeloyl-ACP methyl ester carboxylesterase
MRRCAVDGATLAFDVVGDDGPWLTLSPGGRRDMNDVRSLAGKIARHGFRVLIFDRRNCGLSDISIDPSRAEHQVWVDDLARLLDEVGAARAIIGGGSSGCRLSLRFALAHPARTSGLFLYRITGGPFAATRLLKKYYADLIEAAAEGGMAGVCRTEHFASLIAAREANRAVLMAMDAPTFIGAMSSWAAQFAAAGTGPVIGASLDELASLEMPTLIVPGNDRTHSHLTAAIAGRAIKGSETVDVCPGDLDRDIIPMSEWAPAEQAMADHFAHFARRRVQSSRQG